MARMTIVDMTPKPRFPNGQMEGALGDAPLVISYGMGVDSTAMLVGYHKLGIRPDAILFANVGNEFPQTYAYRDEISSWLERVGFPPIIDVQYRLKRKAKHHSYQTLAGNCLANKTLPSLAFGRKSCSLKWKGQPLDDYAAEHLSPCYRAIGYDCSPADNARFAKANSKAKTSGDVFIYPLQEWGWTRDDCKQAIVDAGLSLPPKSSCFFCPSTKPHELDTLPVTLLRQIVIIEANASANLKSISGLWRKKRMTDYILANQLLPVDEVELIWDTWSKGRVVTRHDIVAEDVLEAASSDIEVDVRQFQIVPLPFG